MNRSSRFSRRSQPSGVAGLLAASHARTEPFPVTFLPADAEALPFPDAGFDVVVSTFGVMFTADEDKAAAELSRVCRPSGRIGLANWTPAGFIGQLFRTIGRHVPPPAGLRSPAQWGAKTRRAGLFPGATIDVTAGLHLPLPLRGAPAGDLPHLVRATNRAFAALEADILALLAGHDQGGRRGLMIPGAHLEVVVRMG